MWNSAVNAMWWWAETTISETTTVETPTTEVVQTETTTESIEGTDAIDGVKEERNVEEIVKDVKTEEGTIEPLKEKEEVDTTKETSKDEDPKEDEEPEEDQFYADDIEFIKNHADEFRTALNKLESERFANQVKIKELTETVQIYEQKVSELRKAKMDAIDDTSLPVLDEKRSLWKAQNRFYTDTSNEWVAQIYMKFLKEELEDVKLSMWTVKEWNSWWDNVKTKTVSQPEKKEIPKHLRWLYGVRKKR